MDIFPNSIDDLNKKIQGFVRDITRPESEEKAAIYTRVSRIDPRHHGYSMDIQPDRAEEYARSKGWDIYAIYADPAKTGRNSRRPSLQKMIGDFGGGRVTVVVVHRLDRLYRNLESLLKFIRMIKAYKCAWYPLQSRSIPTIGGDGWCFTFLELWQKCISGNRAPVQERRNWSGL
jgi:hypothetical protein